MMKRDEFERLCDAASAGEEIKYHVGSLMFDRLAPAFNFPEVDCLARIVWAAMEAGKVRLVQRRLLGRTTYLAIKLPAPYKPVIWEGCYEDHKLNSKPRVVARNHHAAVASIVARGLAASEARGIAAAHA